MRLPGEMNLHGRNDLFVVDLDSDGTVDGVVRALDRDGDGLNDTFIRYDEDGEIQAIGRLDPESKEFEVIYEDADDFEDLVSSLGLVDAPAPDEALFTTLDDPYFVESFGTPGEEVPDALDVEFAPAEIAEVDGADLESLETGAAIVDGQETLAAADGPSNTSDAESAGETVEGQEAGEDKAESDLPEVTARVVEIEDYSGASDGSDLHARVDRDGDGLAEDDERLFRTSDGTWHGDIDKDGYSDEVAFDRDQDGRIESVDTAGRGSSTDTVGAEQVVSPESEKIVDRRPGESDFRIEAESAAADRGVTADQDAAANTGTSIPEVSAEGWQVTDADGDADGLMDDSSAAAAGSGDNDFASDADSGAGSDSADDSASSYDSGSGASSTDTDADSGSTTIDSGQSDPDGTDTT
jgi:hypothetical protein